MLKALPQTAQSNTKLAGVARQVRRSPDLGFGGVHEDNVTANGYELRTPTRAWL